jgi:hypothetical protein
MLYTPENYKFDRAKTFINLGVGIVAGSTTGIVAGAITLQASGRLDQETIRKEIASGEIFAGTSFLMTLSCLTMLLGLVLTTIGLRELKKISNRPRLNQKHG